MRIEVDGSLRPRKAQTEGDTFVPTLAPLRSALLVRYGLAAILGLILIVGCSTSAPTLAPTMGATPTPTSTATPFPTPTAAATLAPTACHTDASADRRTDASADPHTDACADPHTDASADRRSDACTDCLSNASADPHTGGVEGRRRVAHHLHSPRLSGSSTSRKSTGGPTAPSSSTLSAAQRWCTPSRDSPLCRSGIIDLVHTAAGYFGGEVPEGTAFSMLPAPPALSFQEITDAWHTTGALDLINGIYENKAGVRSIGFHVGGQGFGLIMVDEINSVAELEGKRIRVWDAMGASIMTAAGAVPQTIPASELYTALQRGTVDGALRDPFAAWSQGERDVYRTIVRPSHLHRGRRWLHLRSSMEQPFTGPAELAHGHIL